MKPSIPKGTRDFMPAEMARRNYIFDTIKTVFRLYGYSQIETPAMENLSTLMGKYGEEGDKLLFKILNSGGFYEQLVDISTDCQNLYNELEDLFSKSIDKNRLTDKIDEVAQNSRSELFKRYVSNKSSDIANYVVEKSLNFKGFKRYFDVHRKPYIKFPKDYSSKQILKDISEKGLRYDLTVPFARFVVQNRDKISFPFRRYQIQPV